jgi:release factor glutamine methyltransferase
MARLAKPGTIRNELLAARSVLDEAGVANGWLDAEVLLAHVLRRDRAWLHGHPEQRLTPVQARRFQKLVGKRAARVPVAYLTGEREFYGHRIAVSTAVLVPRPETELLVDLAIQWLRDHPEARRVVDLGTGSGAVAIAIARAVPSVRVTAIDVSAGALRVAAKNIADYRLVSRIDLRRGNLLEVAPHADLIAANLPYVSATRLRHGGPELAYEPIVALDGGRDGLDLIRRTIAQSPATLRRPGSLLFECDPPQTGPIAEVARGVWAAATVTIHKDLAGRERVVGIAI